MQDRGLIVSLLLWKKKTKTFFFFPRRIPRNAVYRFSIGAVKVFEKQLDMYQQQLGIEEDEFVNVTYRVPPTGRPARPTFRIAPHIML